MIVQKKVMRERKRENGVYYTSKNPFYLKPFKEWFEKQRLDKNPILEPFAGDNDIIKSLKKEYSIKAISYDINPQSKKITKQDTMRRFPTGFKTCITNPPWLSNYSARRRNIKFPVNLKYNDLYKECLNLALSNCDYVAFLIPASFINSQLFRERLTRVIFINDKIFNDTEAPVCLAMFNKNKSPYTYVYNDNDYVGELNEMENKYLNSPTHKNIKIDFNSKKGNIGLICIDNTKKPSIKFCDINEIKRTAKPSDRAITKIKVEGVINTDDLIVKLNLHLQEIREDTKDILFTTFKGLRQDGLYRRRIDFGFARKIILSCV